MTVYITYCSAQKKQNSVPLPAIERYQSRRIAAVYEQAQEEQIPFYILSGKFALLHALAPVVYYDYLLPTNEVSSLALLVATRLREIEVSKIVYFTNSPEQEPNVLPYLNCIELAAQNCAITLEIKLGSYID